MEITGTKHISESKVSSNLTFYLLKFTVLMMLRKVVSIFNKSFKFNETINQFMAKQDISKWPIPACLFIGIGVGLLLVKTFPVAIPAFTLIGLGVGFLITFLISKK